ncbi:MAG: hypothetical protein CSA38_02695 [Flavobacteriales bacterium]|nr:MAG: hypothetical protein CSA38_02695 [Flavobacteriales bacterium]
MKNTKNHTGRNSLIISIMGLITLQLLLYFKYISGWYWHIALSGFEAATIGGFADWFAVKALFREIPIPFVRKHTNIIVKNRAKISEGIVDLVTNEWLSPQVIKEKIAEISIVDKVLNSLKENDTKKFISFVEPLVKQFATSLNLNSFLENQMQRLNVGSYAGKFIKSNIGNKAYNNLWETILDTASKTINASETEEILKLTIQNQIDNYKKESKLKGLLVSIGETTNGIDRDSIAQKLLHSFNDIIENAKHNPQDAIRMKIDHYVLEFSEKLIHNDPETSEIITNIKHKLASMDWNGISNTILSKLKNDDQLENFLNEQLQVLVDKLKQNEDLKSNIDASIKRAIEKIIAENHDEIGKMVETSLASLNDKELVNQIEDKVGNDLQYIRLNGAIVGGLVGVIIALLRMFLTS